MQPKTNDETPDQRRTLDFKYLETVRKYGSVYEVSGEAAVEVFSFAATRDELLQLAKYWIEYKLEISFRWYLYECVGSSDSGIQEFANLRTARIARVLGEGAIEDAEKQVFKKFSDRDPVVWEMFLEGKPLNRDEQGLPIIPGPPATSDVTPKKAKRVKRSS